MTGSPPIDPNLGQRDEVGSYACTPTRFITPVDASAEEAGRLRRVVAIMETVAINLSPAHLPTSIAGGRS